MTYTNSEKNTMKKKYLVVLSFILVLSLKSQTFNTGLGYFNTNQDVFQKGKQFQISVGKRFTKLVSFNMQYSFGNSANITYFYPIYVKYDFNRPNSDTFYNVTETNKFSFNTYLLKVRFYLNSKNKLNLFYTPIIGVSKLTETKKYVSQEYNTTKKYPISGSISFSAGSEFGLEYPLNKKKNILLNISNSFLFIYSKNLITDVYNPSFNIKNTLYNCIQINIRYEFSKQFLNLKPQ